MPDQSDPKIAAEVDQAWAEHAAARQTGTRAMESHLARALGIEFTSSPQASAVSEPAAWTCPQPSPREEGRAR